MRRCAGRRDRLGRKPPPRAGNRTSAAEAADNGEQDPEHRALFRDLGFLPHDCDKNADTATNSLEGYGKTQSLRHSAALKWRDQTSLKEYATALRAW